MSEYMPSEIKVVSLSQLEAKNDLLRNLYYEKKRENLKLRTKIAHLMSILETSEELVKIERKTWQDLVKGP